MFLMFLWCLVFFVDIAGAANPITDYITKTPFDISITPEGGRQLAYVIPELNNVGRLIVSYKTPFGTLPLVGASLVYLGNNTCIAAGHSMRPWGRWTPLVHTFVKPRMVAQFENGTTMIDRAVTEVSVHPLFSHQSCAYDIALVRVDTMAPYLKGMKINYAYMRAKNDRSIYRLLMGIGYGNDVSPTFKLRPYQLRTASLQYMQVTQYREEDEVSVLLSDCRKINENGVKMSLPEENQALKFSMVIQKGMSGGGTLSLDGELVGIHSMTAFLVKNPQLTYYFSVDLSEHKDWIEATRKKFDCGDEETAP